MHGARGERLWKSGAGHRADITMKIHHDIEFAKLRSRLGSTGTMDERVELLRQLVALNPRDPKNRGFSAKYRAELAKLQRHKSMSRKHAPQTGYSAIHYSRQVAVVGETNTGKSTLLARLTGATCTISDKPFTTFKPEVGTALCNDVPVQVVEVPAVFPGDSDPDKFRFLRNTDVLCICVRKGAQAQAIVDMLEDALILPVPHPVEAGRHKQRPKDEILEKPALVAAWDPSIGVTSLEAVPADAPDEVRRRIYGLLGIQRMYCERKDEGNHSPAVFDAARDVTVEDLALSVDRRLLKTYGRARVYGMSAAYEGQVVGLQHVLADGDRAELIR